MKFKLNDSVIYKGTTRGTIIEIKEPTYENRLSNFYPEKTILFQQSTGYKYWVYEKDIILDEQKIRNDKINLILKG